VQHSRRQSAEALDSYRRAVQILQQLFRTDDSSALVRHNLALSHSGLAEVHLARGERAEAIDHFQQARGLFESGLDSDPQAPNVRVYLLTIYEQLGPALADTGRADEAVAVYQRFIRVIHQTIGRMAHSADPVRMLRDPYYRLTKLQRDLGRPADAVATALEYKAHCDGRPSELYNVACDISLCIPRVGKGNTDLTPDEQAERQKYSDLAMETLRQAVAAGWKDAAHMNKDADLNPLRSREDFRKLLHTLEKN
jgi:tetratricopeptide (TPR) repeat protein